jgi:hypothetical protein
MNLGQPGERCAGPCRKLAGSGEPVLTETKKESRVRDLVFTLVTIGFFLVAIGYLRGCERLK